MSTEANAALAWPIEITEFAYIGDQLVNRKKTPAQVRRMWNDGPNGTEDRDDPWFLCGTDEPGNVRFDYDGLHAATFYPEWPEAGVWAHPHLQGTYICRPFRGDWLSDPTIRVEGAQNGNWAMYSEFGPAILLEPGPDDFAPVAVEPNTPTVTEWVEASDDPGPTEEGLSDD